MRTGHIFALVSVLICSAAGVAMAVRPSGPGQSTAANSLSVAVASDQRLNVSPGVATKVTAVTRGTDMSSNCTDGILVGAAGDGGLLVKPAANSDAAVSLFVVSGQFIPLAAAQIVDDAGTSVGAGLNCLSH
jgi:hypothetical protein